MTEPEDPDDARRDAAVRAFKERQAAEARAKTDREAAERDRAKVLAQNRAQWPTAFQTIHRGVMASSNAFARKRSDYVIPPRPNVGKDTAVSYEIRPSGSLDVVATLTFAMGANGMVHPDTSAVGCDPFPALSKLLMSKKLGQGR